MTTVFLAMCVALGVALTMISAFVLLIVDSVGSRSRSSDNVADSVGADSVGAEPVGADPVGAKAGPASGSM